MLELLINIIYSLVDAYYCSSEYHSREILKFQIRMKLNYVVIMIYLMTEIVQNALI